MSLMWFYDDVPEEYRVFRQEAERLEREHLETRKALQEAETALRADPDNPALQNDAAELKDKLAELDKRAPRISRGDLLEMLIWGSPH
jgi:DNA-binding transcriptional regulator GbsR (MarR family)